MNSQVITLKTPDQVRRLRKANRIVAEILVALRDGAAAGMSTLDLDRQSVDLCKRHQVKPAFLGLYGYPRSLCISLNEEIVHGIPSAKRILKEGDLVSIDYGVVFEGMYGDAAISFGIGRMTDQALSLMRVTEESLYQGIAEAHVGNRVGDISAAVQAHVETHGFSVVRDFVGHGIGEAPHEPPQVPNYGRRGAGPRLKAGMVLALEPMVTAGDWSVVVLDDGWTAVTEDGSLAAHFEHSVLITENGPEILSQLEL
ncbi:MAG: type I methionyl aminopeptidase [Myxococcales bacterium]|nr:type I methionyl aminopeptidase [Myxococcales bacterium]